MTLSLIFPLAGREGDDFRAFREAGGESLIHRALRSFAPFRGRIGAVHCFVLREKEERFAVSRRLREELAGFDFRLTLLDEATAGTAETVSCGVMAAGLCGPALVCDLDHRLDVTPLFAAMNETPDDCLVSLWPLAGEDLMHAVSRGAAYYGLARCGRGVRIRGGVPRTYYVAVESAMPAVPGFPAPVKALAVVPFGMEEGTETRIPGLSQTGYSTGDNSTPKVG